MSWFGRRRAARDDSAAPRPHRGDAKRETLDHLADFVRTRVGVEAYVEPVTHVTQTTVVLIASTGEWTRRRVPDAAAARSIARDLGIPVYDVQLVGYPQRMRDWNSRQRSQRG